MKKEENSSSFIISSSKYFILNSSSSSSQNIKWMKKEILYWLKLEGVNRVNMAHRHHWFSNILYAIMIICYISSIIIIYSRDITKRNEIKWKYIRYIYIKRERAEDWIRKEKILNERTNERNKEKKTQIHHWHNYLNWWWWFDLIYIKN